jgi:23S rRNA pseudouridine1911/1915/1917 synthase
VLPAEAAGQRLDAAIARALPEHSRTEIARWIADGRVEVDGRARSKRAAVRGGERVTLRIPPPLPATVEPEDIPLRILYEDAHLLVVDKPPGLTVHPGSGQPTGTLANALVHHIRGLPERLGSDRPGIVHRLDKDTSGVIVVAKTEVTQRRLSRAFAARRVKKTYLACVHGLPKEDAGTIARRIGRSPVHRTKMTVVEEGGRDAVTHWAVERRLPRHALLACRPVTGRTHQIRVHLRAIGHPIVGDALYGYRSGVGEKDAPRLLLHAWRLAFRHPETDEDVRFEAPLPDDFREALDALAT